MAILIAYPSWWVMNQDFGSYLGYKNDFASILQMTERLGTLPKVVGKWHQNPNQEAMTLRTAWYWPLKHFCHSWEKTKL